MAEQLEPAPGGQETNNVRMLSTWPLWPKPWLKLLFKQALDSNCSQLNKLKVKLQSSQRLELELVERVELVVAVQYQLEQKLGLWLVPQLLHQRVAEAADLLQYLLE